ncbi:MAG: type I 3-dehydroquinate dehydratase [Candidatus Kariarchaeaceae archaeon]|jgi:shikimate dehydrogenase
MSVAVILSNYEEALKIIREDSDKDRLYELRLDCEDKLFSIIDENYISPLRIILTVRSVNEGGKIERGEIREDLILKALKMEVGYLDLELNSDIDLITKIINNPQILNCQKLIISQHNFSQNSLEGYNEFYTTCKNLLNQDSDLMGRIVLKYVSKPHDVFETLELLDFIPQFPNQILLGIGKNGDISRTLHGKMKQEFVFGGIFDSETMSHSLLERLSHPDCVMLGLIGQHLNHSLSPTIHQIFLEKSKLDGYYHLLEASNSNRACQSIIKLLEYGFRGFNVTFPYKSSVLNILDYISDEVKSIEAVNTIKEHNGKLQGFNTDISGFSSFLREHNLHKFDSAIIIGSGGGSRAVSQALLHENIETQIISRSDKSFENFPSELSSQVSFMSKSEISKPLHADIYINATPLGLKGEDPRDFFDIPKNTKVVIDLLYDKNDTKFIRNMKIQGIEAYDGKHMLFNQAAESFKIWTNNTVKKRDLFEIFLKEI